MKRTTNAKFPNSAQLFKFCQRVLNDQKTGKVHDQDVGSILSFSPSDCSHWKRGAKNVRSVFALEKLSHHLKIETGLIHDVASGNIRSDEAFFEYRESNFIDQQLGKAKGISKDELEAIHSRIELFVDTIHKQCEFDILPLYLPEVLRFFSYVSTQPADMLDKLSRILKVKQGKYCIQFARGELKPQTRLSMTRDLSRIIFEGERERYPELGEFKAESVAYEELVFATNLLIPKKKLLNELTKLDVRKNLVSELASIFWAPKSLVCLQLREIIST